MAVSDFTDWLGVFCAPGVALFVKRLSGNDTLANGAHQAGPYIPKDFLFRIFPVINRTDEKNPDHRPPVTSQCVDCSRARARCGPRQLPITVTSVSPSSFMRANSACVTATRPSASTRITWLTP